MRRAPHEVTELLQDWSQGDDSALERLIAIASSIDLGEALEIAIQVASALVASHRVKIIHQNIKPENIMIHEEDGFQLLRGYLLWPCYPRYGRLPHFV